MERSSAALLAILGITVWWLSGGFPELADGHPGPALFPRLVAAGLGGTAILLWIWPGRPATGGGTVHPVSARAVLRLGAVVTAVALFPLLRPVLGFVVTLALVGTVVALIVQARLTRAVPTVLVSAVIIYWLFTALLGVPL